MIELTSQAEKALELLENSGFEAFVVGGFVRDCVMQRHCNDVDITTNAFPEEIKFSASCERWKMWSVSN